MRRVYAVARGLAILRAIVAGVMTIPMNRAMLATVLVALGAISAIGNTAEENRNLFLLAIVLTVISQGLAAVLVYGQYLQGIFSNLGLAVVGAAAMGVAAGIFNRIKADWSPSPS
jgi:hypothetical protein